jgi:KDO2-lipid IV(A) lauroyltransferase
LIALEVCNIDFAKVFKGRWGNQQMPKSKSKTNEWIQFVFIKVATFLVKIIPLTWSQWVWTKICLLAFKILKSRRLLTIENIHIARKQGFLQIDTSDYQLARQVWENLGLVGSEFLYFYTQSPERIKHMVKIEGQANLDKVLSQKKGIVLVMAHIGNWELLGIYLSIVGYSLSPIVQTQSNALLDEIIQKKRQSVGMKTIPKTSFLRPIVEAFKRNEIVPFLMDQYAGKEGGVFVDFFGSDTFLPRGPAEFALKTGTPVVFAYIVHQTLNQHLLVISEEIQLKKTGNYQQDLKDNTALFGGLIQEVIQKYPSQWMWMHKLWPSKIKV